MNSKCHLLSFCVCSISFAYLKSQTCPSGSIASGEIHKVIAAIAESKKLGSLG